MRKYTVKFKGVISIDVLANSRIIEGWLILGHESLNLSHVVLNEMVLWISN